MIQDFDIDELEKQLGAFGAWLWANYSADGRYPIKFNLSLTQDNKWGMQWRVGLRGEPTLLTDDSDGMISYIVNRVSDWQMQSALEGETPT